MDDRLSFRGFMERTVYGQLPESLNIPEHQRVFPHPARPQAVHELIEELGKVDICFGGIGINGHLAFNEAEEVSAAEFAGRETRIIEISRETRVANAIGDLNGAIDAMPRYAVTVGMLLCRIIRTVSSTSMTSRQRRHSDDGKNKNCRSIRPEKCESTD